MTRWSVRHDDEEQLLVPRCVERVRALVRTGVLKPGDRLPSEPELAVRMGVSRTTLRAAIAELVTESILEKRRGIGTFVTGAPPALNHGLERLFGGTESIARLGMKPGTSDLEVGHVPLPAELADKLSVAESEPVIRLRRTRTADGVPVMWTEEWIPESVISPPTALDDFSVTDSLTARLRHVGIDVRTAKAVIHPVIPPSVVQRKLDLCKGKPVLLLEQLVYSGPISGTPTLLSYNFYNSERVELHAIRRA